MSASELNTVMLALVALITALTPIVLALINRKAARALKVVEESAEAAVQTAVKVESVRNTLRAATASTDEQLVDLARVTNETHILVNSQMGNQLKIAAIALRRLADISKHPDDLKAAQTAEEALTAHESKQAVVDAGKTHETKD